MKLFIFGSTGDLVKRKVLPALQALNNKNLEIYALGRKEFVKEFYHDFACEERCTDDFKANLHYKVIQFNDKNICTQCESLFEKKVTNYFYISLPPKLFKEIIIELGKMKKRGGKIKILFEKPFGESLENAKELLKLIKKHDLKEEVFLSDHYLFKKNILKLKKQNPKKVKMTSLEKVGLEGRMGYYDEIGALKDMIQSHFVNTMLKIVDKKEFEEVKIKKYIKAQYGNGANTGYVKELGKKSSTETFAQVKLDTKNVEFEFITGKAFDKKVDYLEVDGKIIKIDTGENPYTKLFDLFFRGKKEHFPTIENALISWKLINTIEKQKTKLSYYKKGTLTTNLPKK